MFMANQTFALLDAILLVLKPSELPTEAFQFEM